MAKHKEEKTNVMVIISHLFTYIIFKTSVAIRMTSQTANLATTGQSQRSVLFLHQQFIFQRCSY